MSNTVHFRELTEKYLTNRLTSEERKELAQLINQPEYQDELETIYDEVFSAYDDSEVPSANRTNHFIKRLKVKMLEASVNETAVVPGKRKFYYILRWAAAAVFISFLVVGTDFFMMLKKKEVPVLLSQAERFKNDVAPGQKGAILTLSNGKKIVLDSAGNGALTKDGNVAIFKKNGEVVYKGVTAENLYNTMTTPKGRQYQVVLSDGTKVWLNAASSIHYPLVFTGNDRVVEITGEVYFEVAHRTSQLFKVKLPDGSEVQVLGTHFNINSYNDEDKIQTTLLQGSVKIVKSQMTRLLIPGQQAKLNKNGSIEIAQPNLEQVMAWKDGLFMFSHTDLKVIMRQLSRWYDVNIVYEGKVPEQFYDGDIPQDVNISSVLSGLEYTGAHFKIEGRKITVMP